MEKQNEDDWSDVDESLLVQCDHEGPSGTEAIICDKSITTGSRAEGKENTDPASIIPLRRLGKWDYFCVTDLSSQLWCEQQMSYTLMGIEPEQPAPGELPLPPPVADRPEVKAGKSVHLARELELHDVVNVKVTSKADKWAVHILNLVMAMRQFLAGVPVAREVPIFGDPFGTGDLFFGIIDELGFDVEKYAVGLVELKTRKSHRLPGLAQNKQHLLQVHIYKRLWDNLVKGQFSVDLFLNKLLTISAASQPFGEEVARHLDAAMIDASNMNELLSLLTMTAQSLVCVSSVEIEYVLQDTQTVIGRVPVEEEADWLEPLFHRCMDYWHGRREVEGVEIEEVWKCNSCQYRMMCEWRKKKNEHLQSEMKQRTTKTKQ